MVQLYDRAFHVNGESKITECSYEPHDINEGCVSVHTGELWVFTNVRQWEKKYFWVLSFKTFVWP